MQVVVSIFVVADRPRTEAETILYKQLQRNLHATRAPAKDQHADARPEGQFRDSLCAIFQPQDTQNKLTDQRSNITEQRYLRYHRVLQLLPHFKRRYNPFQNLQGRTVIQK